MSWDWRAFLTQHRIDFSETGPSARRGYVNVRCPFCGEADTGFHLGIALRGQHWSCWRDNSHRGRGRARIIQALLRCSTEESRLLADDEGLRSLPESEDVSEYIRGMLVNVDERLVRVGKLVYPREFKPLYGAMSVLAQPFRRYLREERGYRDQQIDWIANAYDLQYATRGPWERRIIIPVKSPGGALLSWTARAVSSSMVLRYKALRSDQSVVVAKDNLLGLPLLWTCPNPRALVVCEGPFDAMWVTLYGYSLGVYATCLFGLSISDAQADLLSALRERFPKQAMLLDTGAAMQAFRLANSGVQFDRILHLPFGAKDPAELTPDEVLEICVALI